MLAPSNPPDPRSKVPVVADVAPINKRAQSAGGQPIGFLMQQALTYPDLISLAAGFVDQPPPYPDGRYMTPEITPGGVGSPRTPMLVNWELVWTALPKIP